MSRDQYGITQQPMDYNRNSRLTPEIAAALKDQTPEIRRGVLDVANQPATPDRGVNK